MSATNGEHLPFWQVNIPAHLREQHCPDYLVGLSEKDKGIISTRDEDYQFLQWPEVKNLILTNRIDQFSRKPSELRKYRQYTHGLIKGYGSIMNFVVKERLKWNDLTPTAPPFTNADDLKVLFNDWPYGIDSSIAHLVIWTKFDLEDDPTTDDLTPEGRRQIEDFVESTFRSRVPADDIIWFKNWRSLKSVHAVEHFHVMLNRPSQDFLVEITNGDVPLARKLEIDCGDVRF